LAPCRHHARALTPHGSQEGTSCSLQTGRRPKTTKICTMLNLFTILAPHCGSLAPPQPPPRWDRSHHRREPCSAALGSPFPGKADTLGYRRSFLWHGRAGRPSRLADLTSENRVVVRERNLNTLCSPLPLTLG